MGAERLKGPQKCREKKKVSSNEYKTKETHEEHQLLLKAFKQGFN